VKQSEVTSEEPFYALDADNLFEMANPSIVLSQPSSRSLTVVWLGRVDYLRALELQNALATARYQDEIADCLLLLEHPHVYTLGRGADERFILNPGSVPVYRISRGGQVTYHGPGQLIGYPILKFEGADRDVIRYLRCLEEVLIESLSKLGIVAQQRPGLTGVWIGLEKIASIGVGFRRWVSLHGFALNVTTDLSFFDAIVPCGIAGCRMTSIAAQSAGVVDCQSFSWTIAERFAAGFGYRQLMSMSDVQITALLNRVPHGCEARLAEPVSRGRA
jgi:lipoyl(octanoyl) transferase